MFVASSKLGPCVECGESAGVGTGGCELVMLGRRV